MRQDLERSFFTLYPRVGEGCCKEIYNFYFESFQSAAKLFSSALLFILFLIMCAVKNRYDVRYFVKCGRGVFRHMYSLLVFFVIFCWCLLDIGIICICVL